MQSREPSGKTRTVCVVPVSTLGVGEDSEQSFQHQGEGVGQQGPEDGGQGPARRRQGPLRGWDDCPHGFAEVARAQDNGGGVQLELDAAAVDLWVPAAQRHQDRLCAKCFDVGAAVAWKRAGRSECALWFLEVRGGLQRLTDAFFCKLVDKRRSQFGIPVPCVNL